MVYAKKVNYVTICVLSEVMERYLEKKRDLHMIFISLGKAYYRVFGEVMW